MTPDKPVYPDISDILALKDEGRREIRARSFGEKIAMVEKMRERLAPLKRLREERRAIAGARLPQALGENKSADTADDQRLREPRLDEE
ncbi:MAG TPA: hypothetical protein VH684_29710 [Xanthobacteraceae bacterium]|jgi:hypothetical protein